MKKFALVCFIAVLGLALTAPVYALENEFGGYFRTRMYNQTDFDGVDNDTSRANEVQVADTRTRLYYTAKLNDNLKFVNKFEFDATWGGAGTYGDIGADQIAVEIKNSYIDFNWMDANFKIGVQGGVIQRGFVMDTDFSGVAVSAGGFTGIYIKAIEADDTSGNDTQAYHVKYALGMEGLTLTPNFTYLDAPDETYVYFLGLDLDGAAGGFSYWGTFIYEGGEYDAVSVDQKAWLLAGGAGMALSDALELHVEAFYATGDDDPTDDDYEAFDVHTPLGDDLFQSYYWAEIMGLGIFDNQASANSCADAISNVLAANIGVGFKVSDKLSLGADVWWAQLAEDNANGDKDLGTEIDLSAKYTIVEGLSLDLVAAYLFAGDATTMAASDDADPIEIGARFSISF